MADCLRVDLLLPVALLERVHRRQQQLAPLRRERVDRRGSGHV